MLLACRLKIMMGAGSSILLPPHGRWRRAWGEGCALFYPDFHEIEEMTMSFDRERFLPVSIQDMERRGWDFYDFLLITGDAYVDHPSFGPAIIGRVLEAEGYRVAMLAQPDWRDPEAFAALGRPRLGVLLSAGNIDSMVAHYTAAKKRRHDDAYSPGRRAGLRPDHATIVYSNRVREVFGDIPLVIGGLEASLRRFAHYDYWEDKVRRSILFDAQADLLTYGMGERATIEIAARLASGTPVGEITDVRGTCAAVKYPDVCTYPRVEVPSFEEVSASKEAYARANMVEYQEHDAVVGRAILQKHGRQFLLVNPPAFPLTTEEMDRVAELPYVREPHPMYDEMGGVPAIEEVRFSVTHNRGCFGACNFCSLAFHQGRTISCRSHQSVIREVKALTEHPGFKGYIHDVGGPSATFRRPSCQKQLKHGMCKNRACLAPEPCPNLDADHTDYMLLLRKLREIPKVKKVFIRSGIRFDYLMKDPSGEFLPTWSSTTSLASSRWRRSTVWPILWTTWESPTLRYMKNSEKSILSSTGGMARTSIWCPTSSPPIRAALWRTR